MNVYPVVLDSRPAFLHGRPGESLLLVPLGRGTLLDYVRARLLSAVQRPPVVLATFDGGAAWEPAIRAAVPDARAVLGPGRFHEWLSSCEPSDWLLLLDPRCFPAERPDPADLLRHTRTDPRWAKHLVALDADSSGTRERVDLDAEGRVRRIQRHYDGVTWPFTAGVSSTLLPVSAALVASEPALASLAELRKALASHGVPSRDLPLRGGALDLSDERGLLHLCERAVVEAAGERGPSAGPVLVGSGHVIHPAARIVGPVVLHGNVVVEEDATLLGPTLVGPRARIGAGAIVAQCLVPSDTVVPSDWLVRHRALFEGLPAGPPAVRDEALPLYRGPGPGQEPPPAEADAEDGGRSFYVRARAVVEPALALAALVLLSPLLLLLALLVRLDSRGPVLYGHKREGRGGRVFRCWKFRTMFEGAEARQRELEAQNQMDGPQFKMDRDPRITRMGRWLRPTSLDELPQLLNVLFGQMSFVGPRPSPFRENQLCVPWREGRLSVRPGITGLWQVCRHDRSSGDFHQWIQYDLLYVRHVSLSVDLKIVLATLLTLGGKGHVPLEWIIPRQRLEGAGGEPAR